MACKNKDNEPFPARPLWRRLVPPACLMLLAAAALTIDGPLARWWAAIDLPGDLRRLLTWSEFFGHGLGAALVLVAVYVLDPGRRWRLPRVVAATAAAGLTANLVKAMIGRTRPHAYDIASSALESFQGWWTLGAGGSTQQSFPSAHTATAVGLALALAWLYPRGRWLFAALALLVACQRMQCGAHFPSDTLAGAGVGWLAAIGFLPGGLLAWTFDWLEGHLRRAEPPAECGHSCSDYSSGCQCSRDNHDQRHQAEAA